MNADDVPERRARIVARNDGSLPPLPRLVPPAPAELAAVPDVEGEDAEPLSMADYRIVAQVQDRVSTRLAAEDTNYSSAARREFTKMLIREEYEQWLLHEANLGHAAPEEATEEKIFGAVLDEIEGLGRLGPLLRREDIEDIHFEGADPTVLRLKTGELVDGPALVAREEDLVPFLRATASRSGDGQASREFSSANPILHVRMKGGTPLGARLQAAMDVLPRAAGVIRVHRWSAPSMEDLQGLGMIDSPVKAFLYAVVMAKRSLMLTGLPGVGKTTALRALGHTIDFNNVLICVEDERELGLHLPRWDPVRKRMVKPHAVCRSFEARLANAEGQGEFGMGQALSDALRMSPNWVLVGEVRGEYVTHILDAVTDGLASVMCTIHSPSAHGIFDKVLNNAQRRNPPPEKEMVMRSLAAFDLVVHIERDDRSWKRYVSGIYELGPVGDSGRPDLKNIFVPRDGDRRAVATGAGHLSTELRARLEAVNFNFGWLDANKSDWQVGSREQAS